jgi:hypothetical protein
MKDTTGDEWRVDIYDDQYSGAVDLITLSGEGFAINWNGDIRNKVNPIITSEAAIEFVMQDATDENIMALIAGSAEGRFTVAIYQIVASLPVLYWSGTIMTDQVAYLDEYYPIRAEIRATDDLGALQDLPYDNAGTAYTNNQYKTVIGHVHEALLKTRHVANFYASTDDLLYYANDFYSVDDDVSVTDHLNETRIYNLVWNNPDDDGTNRTRSAYEVLEHICITYNARLMYYGGLFRFMPIGVYQYDETSIDIERLKFDGTSNTSFTDTSTFKVTGTNFEKLNGYRFEFLQPYRQIKRTQEYFGNQALIADSVYDLLTSPTISDTDIDYASGSLLKLSGGVVLTYQGDGTTTGNARVGRFLVRITLQVGTYYLRRDVTFSGTAYDFQMEPGTVLSYTNGTMGATSWNASAETFDTITPVFDRNAGASGYNAVMYTLNQVLPSLPTDLSGLDFEAEVYDVSETGTLTLATSSTYTGQINSLRVDWVEEGATNGDALSYTATGQDTNRDILDQGTVAIGDKVSNNSRGVLLVATSGGADDSTGWRSLNVTTGSLSIHRLGVEEVQALHNTTTSGVQGTLYSDLMGPHQLLKDDGLYYMATSMSIAMNNRRIGFQGFKLSRDLTSITSDDDGRRNINPPVDGNDGVQVGLNLAAFTNQPGAVNSVNSVSPVSGDVTIDSDDIDYTGGAGTVTGAIGSNITNIDNLKAYVVSGTDKVELTEDASNKVIVDASSGTEAITLQSNGTAALKVTDTEGIFSGTVESTGLEATSNSDSLILKDSGGTRWRVQVQTDGTLRTTSL